MILQIFSVFDVKSDLYGVPFFMPSRGQAIRAFSDLAVDPQAVVSRYPDDFQLRVIGSFNDATGEVVSDRYVSLGFARDFVRAGAAPGGGAPLDSRQLELVPPEVRHG